MGNWQSVERTTSVGYSEFDSGQDTFGLNTDSSGLTAQVDPNAIEFDRIWQGERRDLVKTIKEVKLKTADSLKLAYKLRSDPEPTKSGSVKLISKIATTEFLQGYN